MARTSVMTGGSNSFQTTAEDLNAIATDFISDGIVGAVTATSGVAPTTGGLSVNAQGTPDRTVAIGAGYAYVTATPTSQASQRLRVKIDAQNLTHATNGTGATRYDWIYVQVSASLAANPAVAGDTTGTVVISRSTSNSVDNGTPPTYGYHIATVTLTNAYTTIVNGNIADTRVRAGAVASSTTSTASVSSSGLTNPYKFSAYRNAALTPGASDVVFDTELYDTGGNHSTSTGAFTATVAGWYWFDSALSFSMTAANVAVGVSLYKNGAETKRGNLDVYMFGSAFTITRTVSGLIQLAISDTVTVRDPSNSGKALAVGAATSYFEGFLVSTT